MSLFGQSQQQSGGGLFGQQPKTAGGGLFGTSATTSAQPQSGGLFGSAPQQAGTGGLFGSSQQQQPQQQSGGLFAQQQQQQQQQQGSSLFGQPQQQSSGLFGQSTQQGQTAQSGGLFTGQQQQQPTGGSLFGQPQQQQSGGGLFGQSQQQPQQQTGGLFGQPQQQQGGFGGSILGGSTVNQQQIQLQQQQGPNPVVEKIQRIKNSWDPNHPEYAFRYYFFNHIGKERASQYQKPPYEDSAAWEKAWSERPNDNCVPVRANGFRELDIRVKTQENQVQIFRKELWTIQEKLNAIQNRHDLNTSIKLEDCRRRHMALSRRALSLAAKVQVLKNRGYALQPEEEMLKKRLEGLAKLVQDPAATGRMNEIWARMMVVQEKARVMEESLGKVEIVWDEKQLQVAGKLLQSNAAGLEYLHKEVRDIENTFRKWEESQKGRPTV